MKHAGRNGTGSGVIHLVSQGRGVFQEHVWQGPLEKTVETGGLVGHRAVWAPMMGWTRTLRADVTISEYYTGHGCQSNHERTQVS